MSYAQHRIKHIRGSILYFTAKTPANDKVLLIALEDMGLAIAHDMLQGIIAWLEQAGLVKVKQLDDIAIISITQSGMDIVKNRARHPEIILPEQVV